MFSGKKLKSKREELGMSQATLANMLGISRPSYFNWENDKTQPNHQNRLKLASILNVSDSFFESEFEIVEIFNQLTEINQKKSIDYSKELLNQQKAVEKILDSKTKRYEYHVYERLSAGSGFSYFGDGNFDTVYYDEDLDHDFASWVYGDSMEPIYQNGEVVLIKQSAFDYDGAIYAVDWNGQTYIKKVYREKEGLRLVSLNKKYPDMLANFEEEPRIIGLIVGNFTPLEV